jgi:hypothetical protein
MIINTEEILELIKGLNDCECEDCEMCEEEEGEELILVNKNDLMEIMYQTEVAYKALQKILC